MKRRRWRPAPRTLARLLAALLLAATFLEPHVTLPRPRYEHLVVLDVTQSMNVPDMALQGRPASRLDAAKSSLRGALEALPCGSRVGLAIFTEYRSFLLLAPVEVCANRAEWRATLAMMDGRMAWSGNSEIAKGLHSAFGIAKALPGKPSLVFVTDGHEAPPLNPRFRPRFDDDKPGEVPGLLLGAGALKPSPIPKLDPRGRPLGTWGPDEVMQTDPRSQGRGGSVGGERMVDDGSGGPATGLGATPGAEHLSALREPYLQRLAGETGLRYDRLGDARSLASSLQARELARDVPVQVDLRLLLAALALALLMTPWLALAAAPLRRVQTARRAATRAADAG